MKAPNFIRWWVIPFVVSMFISLVITIYILHYISKSIKTTCLRLIVEEDNRDETCESTGLPFFVKLIVMLVAPILVIILVIYMSIELFESRFVISVIFIVVRMLFILFNFHHVL